MASHSRSAGPVLTVTANPTVDVCLDVDRLCTEGKNRALVHSVQAGGGGINVARCLRRLAIPARAVYVSGGDTGRRLDRLLAEENITARRVRVAGETRKALVVTETATGHSYHIVPPGPVLSTAEVDLLREAVLRSARECTHVVVTGSAPPGLPNRLPRTSWPAQHRWTSR
ncbi:PfkB family carbohydrate kinase [Nocardia farcinica]|uniref:PfkB family carbohydrate kinase n=1 Tax=Nocardia farcinica TaxID=37329 RepID=UPI001892D4A3|nr:PfkB family carbohydrate kinase [Nocardia farcinica]MBF6445313.1 hypothetical protein [Nocardia farcinica]